MSRPTWFIVPRTPGLAAAGLLLVLGGCATSAPAPAPEPGSAEVPTPAAMVKRPSFGGRTRRSASPNPYGRPMTAITGYPRAPCRTR